MPVAAATWSSHVIAFAVMVAPDSPSVTSRSSVGGRSPGSRVPICDRNQSASVVGSMFAWKKWYALRTTPLCFIPAQFAAKVGSE